MTRGDFELQLTDWLAAESSGPEPADLVATSLAVTSRTSQIRPGSIEARLHRLRQATVPGGRPLRLAIVVALLIAALIAALSVGALRQTLPDNGLVTLQMDGDLWVVAADGQGLDRLTRGPGDDQSPLWSPRGDRLAYLTTEGGSVRLMLLDHTTGRSRELELPSGATIAEGGTIEGWSPDGRSLLVPVTDGAGVVSAAVVDVEDGTLERVDQRSSFGFGFSPNGRWLGLKTLHGWYADVVVVGTDGSGLRTLVRDGRILDLPVFTPDSEQVVFHAQSGPTTHDGDISAVDIESGKVRTVVGGITNDLEPRVSPDGRLVAFSRSPTASITAALDHLDGSITPAQLYVAGLHGGEPRLLASDVWPGAVWSPDGTRLLAASHDLRQLLVIPLEGESPPVRLDLPAEVASMNWQPLGP